MPGLPLPILAGVFETIPVDRPELAAVVEDPRGETWAQAQEPTLTSAIVSDVALTGATEITEITGVSVSEPSSAAITSERISVAEIIYSILGAVAEEPLTGAEVLALTGAVVEEPTVTGAAASEFFSYAVADTPASMAVCADQPLTGASVIDPESSTAIAIEELLGAREL